MRRGWWLSLVLVLVLALAVVGLSGCRVSTPSAQQIPPVVNTQQQGIWVNGQGSVAVTPDVAILTLGVQVQAESVAQAQSQAAEAMNKVVAALTSNGVAQKDIQTQYFSIQPLTKYDNQTQTQTVIGYQVTNKVVAKIRDITKVGTVIDAAAAAGGNLAVVDSISFSIEDSTPYEKQAREKAMADAKDKAGQLASLAGVTLGKPTMISETSQLPIITSRVAVSAPTVITPISPGELDVTVNIQVVYAII